MRAARPALVALLRSAATAYMSLFGCKAVAGVDVIDSLYAEGWPKLDYIKTARVIREWPTR